MARDLRLSRFVQRLEEVGADDAYRIVQFSGDVTPLIVLQDKTFRVLSQSGEAVAWNAYLNPPAPLFPGTLLDRPQISKERVGPREYKTTWSYVMALDDADTYNTFTHTRWPADPATTPGFTSP